jgi:hypothetical protein
VTLALRILHQQEQQLSSLSPLLRQESASRRAKLRSVSDTHWHAENKVQTTSNIASVKMPSIMDRRPLAPVSLAAAFFAISLKAFSVICNLTYRGKKRTKTNSCL